MIRCHSGAGSQAHTSATAWQGVGHGG